MEIPSVAILLAALPMIGWKPTLHRLVELVIANEQGNEAGTILSEREVAEWTGMSRTSVWNGFAELVAQQVLVRFDGGGPRGHSYRVNLFPHEWLVPWFGKEPPTMDAPPSREWSAKQEIALSRIYRLICPEIGRKTRSAARPVGALTGTAERAFARLSGPSRATGRATEAPLAARAVARLEDADGRGAQLPSIERPLSLPEQEGREAVDKLAATIANASGAPGVWGRFRRDLAGVVDSDNLDRLIAKVRSTPGLSIDAYVNLCYQAASGSAPLDAVTVPKVRERCDNCGGTSGMLYDAAGLARKCPVCNPDVAPSCETANGGVAP